MCRTRQTRDSTSPLILVLKAGALSAAVTYKGGVVVATVCKTESPLVMDVGTRKIAWVADGVALLYSGLGADSRCV